MQNHLILRVPHLESDDFAFGSRGTLFENESITDINYPELLTPVYQYMI